MFSKQNLSLFYGRKNILKGANVEINSKDIIGLIGPNGSGKSTLLTYIANNCRSTSFTINGPAFYDYMNAYDNLKLSSYLYKKTNNINNIINMVGLNKYKNIKYSKYSTGMKMRLAIARCLLQDVDVYIFDEPLNGLDPESVILFRQIISYLKNLGKTIIVSSHILSELSLYINKLWYINKNILKVYEINNINRSYIVTVDVIPDELMSLKVGDNLLKITNNLNYYLAYILYKKSKILKIDSEDIIEKLYLGNLNGSL